MRSWAFALVVVTMIVVVLNYNTCVRVANHTGALVLYPVLHLQQSINEWWRQKEAEQESIVVLKKRVQALECEKRQLLQELIALYAAHHHATITDSLKHFKDRVAAHNGVIGRVLVTHVDEHEHFLLVEGGQQCAITTEMIALVDGHLIGRVMAVYPYYCKVVLITDKRINIAARCAQTGATGIYHGTNQGPLARLSFVDHLQKVVVGDTILSSGEGLVYPEGLCLGIIATCTKSAVEYDITVKPRIDLHRIAQCLIVHPSEFITAGY